MTNTPLIPRFKSLFLLQPENQFTLPNYKPGLDYAKQQDILDELSSYRQQFHIPKDKNGNELMPWSYMGEKDHWNDLGSGKVIDWEGVKIRIRKGIYG